LCGSTYKYILISIRGIWVVRYFRGKGRTIFEGIGWERWGEEVGKVFGKDRRLWKDS
jgi:hypothetical protein